jgi:hypothetical protein
MPAVEYAPAVTARPKHCDIPTINTLVDIGNPEPGDLSLELGDPALLVVEHELPTGSVSRTASASSGPVSSTGRPTAATR